MDTIRTKDGCELLMPKNYFIFKRLIGDPSNRFVLNGFLRDFLNLGGEEFDVELIDTHLNPQFEADKLSILDVRLKTRTGKQIDVEMQVLETTNFFEHIIYYQSRMIVDQVGKADWYDKIKKVVNIIIADFELVASDSYYHCYRLHDKKDDTYFGDFEEIHVLELPKLPAESDGTPVWGWGKFLGAKTEEDIMLPGLTNPAIEKAAEALRQTSGDAEVRRQYELRARAIRDEHARMKFATEKGISIGEQRGIHIGEQRGINALADLMRSGKSLDEALRSLQA
jgi:predicted transposase/invertase (TIGR01784 family)